jgi:hypothetical protein
MVCDFVICIYPPVKTDGIEQANPHQSQATLFPFRRRPEIIGLGLEIMTLGLDPAPELWVLWNF